ncbi:uncharacterized protein yc1106_06851 [Curvularia clavata]|uniref:Carboxylic ester hydrolase n=1 Tax=Curvularia clavata TaxID=95742 RepID=A0A9Q8ZCJ3_CURCL|nr:uncharacterized protein yc1106_06851 [Curvularia clavata]
MIAQRSPGLVDGILANVPAISIERLVMLGFWPQLLMQEKSVFPLNCELDFARAKAIEHCDRLDHVCDGLLEAPQQCDFDPLTLVGQQVPNCMSDVSVTFSEDVAQLVADFHKEIEWGLEPDTVTRGA